MAGASLGQPLGIVMLNAAGGAPRPGDQRCAPRVGTIADRASWTHVNASASTRTSSSIAWWWSPVPWTVDNGFITPTFKVKRNRIEKGAPRYEGWVGSPRIVWSA